MRLFVNLTTDDTWSVIKAIVFAQQRAQATGHDSAIWLNVRSLCLAEAKHLSHIRGLIADSGTVIMCAACSKAAGLTQADYIDGVVIGNPDMIGSRLFDPNTQTLGW